MSDDFPLVAGYKEAVIFIDYLNATRHRKL